MPGHLLPVASGLQPPASYRLLLENSMPKVCYYQWKSWKIWNCCFRMVSFRAAFLRPLDLWPSHWGIIMLKQQKKCICTASVRLLHQWSKLSALLCLERSFLHLDCPDLWKWKFSHDKETSLSSFVTFWASLQRHHRTFIPPRMIFRGRWFTTFGQYFL